MKLFLKILIICNLIFSSDNRLKIIQADVMQSFTKENNSITELQGNVILQRENLFLYTSKAINYPDLKIFKLAGPVTMVNNADTLKSDNMLYYNNYPDYLLATGNVTYKKPDQFLKCDSLYYWTDIDSGYAIGSVRLNHDNHSINTDYINYKQTNGPKGLSFSAYKNVSIFDNKRLIKTDTLSYNDNSEIMYLKNGGIIKEEKRGLSGDKISIQYEDTLIKKIDIYKNAQAWDDIERKISANDISIYKFRNEMKSKYISMNFKENKIQRMNLFNMSETKYHIAEDSLLMGINHTSGDTIIISFEDNKLSKIQVIGGGEGKFVPEENNAKVDTTINYKSNYINHMIEEGKTELLENSYVKYQDTKLNAGSIWVSWEENILNAFEYKNIYPNIHSGDTEPLTGSDMTFDLISKHGRINKGITEYNDGYYHGDKIFRDEPNIFHVEKSKYTSCELENPHYHFSSNKMKLIGNDRVIAKPLILHIYDIPIVGIPFAVLPNKGGKRHSGWIMPSFGTRKSTGTFFQKFGYFYAPNDYIDIKSLLDFYDKLGIVLNSRFNYVKRYKYSGSISARINQSIINNDIAELFDQYTRQFNVIWNHHQKFDPSQNLSINGHYVSNSNFYQSNWNDKNNFLTQKIESRLNYSKRWSASKNSISLNIADSYDLLSKLKKEENTFLNNQFLVERMQSLPNISFSHSKSKLDLDKYNIPFVKHLYWDYSSILNNNIRKGWRFIYNDSSWVDSTSIRSGIRHNMSFSTSNKLFGWLSISPRYVLKENWVNQYTKLNENYQLKYINGFKRRLIWNTSISLTTKLYGLFPISFGKLDAIRHVVTPSLSFNWSPSFINNKNYIQKISTIDTTLTHDYFYGTLAGSTPSVETKSIGFGVSNIFQAKIYNNESYNKIDLISWTFNSSYNFEADSLKFAPINSNISSKLPNGVRLSVTMSHDLYETNLSGQRINKFKKIPRLKSISCATTLKFKGRKFNFNNKNNNDTEPSKSTNKQIEKDTNINTSNGSLWNSTFNIRYSYTPKVKQEPIINFWLNSKIDLFLTKAWKMNYNARFDIKDLKLITHDFTFKRNLHCFEFLFEWNPSGYRKGFYLKINVISFDLRESIKLESRGGKSFWQ